MHTYIVVYIPAPSGKGGSGRIGSGMSNAAIREQYVHQVKAFTPFVAARKVVAF